MSDFDFERIHQLFGIARLKNDFPHLGKIFTAAEHELQMINDNSGEPSSDPYAPEPQLLPEPQPGEEDERRV